ncbi:hypothetical protein MNEG_13611, partial [Monoraphidium neglectum]
GGGRGSEQGSEAAARRGPRGWGADELLLLLSSLSALDAPPDALRAAAPLRRAARALLPRLGPGALARLLAAAAALRWAPAGPTMHVASLQLWRCMRRLKPGELAAAGGAAARLGLRLGRQWSSRFLACTRALARRRAAVSARHQGELQWAAQYAWRCAGGGRRRGGSAGACAGLPAASGLATRLQRAQALRRRQAQRQQAWRRPAGAAAAVKGPLRLGAATCPRRPSLIVRGLSRPLGFLAWAYRRRLAAARHRRFAAVAAAPQSV